MKWAVAVLFFLWIPVAHAQVFSPSNGIGLVGPQGPPGPPGPPGSSSPFIVDVASLPGVTLDQKLTACKTIIDLQGGGICDATTPISTYQTLNASVTCGGNTISAPREIYWFGNYDILEAAGVSFFYANNCTILGTGPVEPRTPEFANFTGTRFLTINAVGSAGITPLPGLGQVYNVDIENLGVLGTYQTVGTGELTGAVGLRVGAETGDFNPDTDVLESKFSNIRIGGVDIGLELVAGAFGCTCYNHLYDISATGSAYGVYTSSWVTSNIIDGGIFEAVGPDAVGILDGGIQNVYIKPDIEGTKAHGIVMIGHRDLIISPYEENSGPDIFGPNATQDMIEGPSSQEAPPVDTSGGTGIDANVVFGPGFGLNCTGPPTSNFMVIGGVVVHC